MKANQARIEDFLNKTNVIFRIPVYQRNYDWRIEHCRQLMSDITTVGKTDKMSFHFIGSIVYIHDDTYTATSIKELTIIDGQQRLTTLTLIYIAIYHYYKKINHTDYKMIEGTYLINQYASETEKLKLKPTENNDKVFRYLIQNGDTIHYKEHSNLINNYDFISTYINDEQIEIIRKGLSKLIFVDIGLERNNDDPQKIFESLNSTGLALNGSDLIRNYILMSLSYGEQKKIYTNYWLHIEENTKHKLKNENKTTDFIRDFLTISYKDIPNKREVYNEFKKRYDFTNKLHELENFLSELVALSHCYSKLLNPDLEEDTEIRNQLKYIDQLEINVAFPLLMKIYQDYVSGIISKQIFITILEFIQSYVWRRFVVDLPTNSLNKVFASIYEKIDKKDYFNTLAKDILSRRGKPKFPRDNDIRRSLKEKDMYNIKIKNRNYFFERLENYNNKEKIVFGDNTISVEHIFPQTPAAQWKLDIGEKEDYEYLSNNINTIANLTLTGYNSNLGNKSFLEKRDMKNGYKQSKFWLNRYIATLSNWDKEELEKRFEEIYKRFLAIWQIPNIEIELSQKEDEYNLFDAPDPTNRKIDYVVFCGEKKEFKKTVDLYTWVIKFLFDTHPEKFLETELSEKIHLFSNIEKDKIREPFDLNDKYSIETNYSNSAKFNNLKMILEIFELNDELIIKYIDET